MKGRGLVIVDLAAARAGTLARWGDLEHQWLGRELRGAPGHGVEQERYPGYALPLGGMRLLLQLGDVG